MIETTALWVFFLVSVWAKCFIAYYTFVVLREIGKDEGIGVAVLSSVVILPVGFMLNSVANFIMFIPMEEMWDLKFAHQLPTWLNCIIWWFIPHGDTYKSVTSMSSGH